MRFFIALEIPEESKQELEVVQNELASLIPRIRLTDNDKLHLTIAFVGEQPEKIRKELVGVLQSSVANIPPFSIAPAYVDGFPTLHQAKILWTGVKGDIDKLMILRERIKDGLVSLNLEADERRYVPHIALGKVKDFYLDHDTELCLQEMMEKNFADIHITAIKLFESIPEDGFHTHNTLAVAKLLP